MRPFLLLVTTLAVACDTTSPGQRSAECTEDDECGVCGRCDKGACFFDAAAGSRPFCVDESEDPCNGKDDDGNGVIDDPASCWHPIYAFEGPHAVRCFGLDAATPPATCAGYTAVGGGPAFTLPARAHPGAYQVRQCALGDDFRLVFEDADAVPDTPSAPRPREPLAGFETLGYDCSLVLGAVLPSAPDFGNASPPAGVGVACPMWRGVTSGNRSQPLGTHYHAVGAPPRAEGLVCEPYATVTVFTTTQCDPTTPEGCGFATCQDDRWSLAGADQLIADGTVFEPREEAVQEWKIRNSGDTTWTTDYAFESLEGGFSPLTRVAVDHAVPPGESFTLRVPIVAPEQGVELKEMWGLARPDGSIVEVYTGHAFAPDRGVYFLFSVATPHSASLVSLTPPPRQHVLPGAPFDMTFELRNTGPTAWTNAWQVVFDHGTAVLDRLPRPVPDTAPGETATFSFPVKTADGVVGGFAMRWILLDDVGRIVPIDGRRAVSGRVNAIREDNMRYLTTSIPDRTRWPRGTFLMQTWRMTNAGTSTWGPGFTFRQNTGDLSVFASVPLQSTVAPGEDLLVALPFFVPTFPVDQAKDLLELRNAAGQIVPVTAEYTPGNEAIGTDAEGWFWAWITIAPPCVPAP